MLSNQTKINYTHAIPIAVGINRYMNSQELAPTFFCLRQSQEPYHAALTDKVIEHLGPDIRVSRLDGERPRTGDLLVHRTEGASLGFIMESYAPYMGRFQADLRMLIYRLTTSSLPMDGLCITTPYAELRDDRPVTDAGPLALLYAEDLEHADKQNLIKVIGIWEPHSELGTDLVKLAFTKKGKKVSVACLTAARLHARYFETIARKIKGRIAVASADLGNLHRSMLVAKILKAPIIVFDKFRPKIEEVGFGDLYIINPDNGFAVKAQPNDLDGLVAFDVDDLGGTGRTKCDSAEILKKKYGVKVIHSAISHGTLIQPEGAKRLSAAMEDGTIDSIVFTDSVPKPMDGAAKSIPIEEYTAAFMRYVANVLQVGDDSLINEILLPPGPQKKELRELLYSGRLPLMPEDWPPKGTTIAPQETIYQYGK
jgi:hypothetical protein